MHSLIQPEIVLKSTYKNFTYFIVNNGFWYCAYIIIPSSHPFYIKHYDDISIDCHGGLTFSGIHPLVNEFCIGWDYAHYDDYTPLLSQYSDAHHWTIKEIEEECHNVIDQL